MYESNIDCPCITCIYYPPSCLDGKPCCACDMSNPLTSCYEKKEDFTDTQINTLGKGLTDTQINTLGKGLTDTQINTLGKD